MEILLNLVKILLYSLQMSSFLVLPVFPLHSYLRGAEFLCDFLRPPFDNILAFDWKVWYIYLFFRDSTK